MGVGARDVGRRTRPIDSQRRCSNTSADRYKPSRSTRRSGVTGPWRLVFGARLRISSAGCWCTTEPARRSHQLNHDWPRRKRSLNAAVQPEDDAAAGNRNQRSRAPRIRSVSKMSAHDSRAPTIGACRTACTRPSATRNELERCVTDRAALCAMKRFYDIVTMTDDLHLRTRTARCSGCSDTASSYVVGSTESEAWGSTARGSCWQSC